MADKIKSNSTPKPITSPKLSTVYYIQPSYSVVSVGLILGVIVGFMFLIFNSLFILVNWEGTKCKNSNFMFAPLFGKNSSDTFNQCVQDSYNKVSTDTTSALYKKLDKLNTDVNNLTATAKTVTDKAATSTVSNYPVNYNTLLGTINTIQSGLSKILGSVVLSSYLTNGVLQSSNTLQNGELTNLIKQYNNVGSKITDQQTASSALAAMR
jgi:hypothetical protein